MALSRISFCVVLCLQQYVLLTWLFAVGDACRIEVLKILETDVINSKVKFNTTFDDPSNCSNGNGLTIRFRKRNTTGRGNTRCTGIKPGIGQCGIRAEGWFEAFVEEGFNRRVVSDKPFQLSGLKVIPVLKLNLQTTYVEIKFLEKDVKVESWDLTMYEFHGQTYEQCPPNFIPDKNDAVKTWLNVGNNSELKENYNFNPATCYCFNLRANGFDGTTLEESANFITRKETYSCKPERNTPPPDEPIKYGHTYLIVAIVFLVVSTAIAIALWRRKMQGSFIVGLPVVVEPSLKFAQDILVVYSDQDQAYDDRIKDLIQTLRHESEGKVYDLHKTMDESRLQDANEWLRRRIKKDRLVVILSPTLIQHHRVAIHGKDALQDAAEQNDMDPSLLYVLRQLTSFIGINEYSKVFVARYSFDNKEEEDKEDYPDVLANRRRYNLPENQDDLINDILAT